ncbi:hypothetical protein FB451DRAFT_1413574 [Mycena latifolia]|nr:hypothetical protein FB451DRAFT_1413574 [Mycena latifolia]
MLIRECITPSVFHRVPTPPASVPGTGFMRTAASQPLCTIRLLALPALHSCSRDHLSRLPSAHADAVCMPAAIAIAPHGRRIESRPHRDSCIAAPSLRARFLRVVTEECARRGSPSARRACCFAPQTILPHALPLGSPCALPCVLRRRACTARRVFSLSAFLPPTVYLAHPPAAPRQLQLHSQC